MKRRRLLRAGKWTGLVLCMVVAGAWVGSGWWYLTWRTGCRGIGQASAAAGRLELSFWSADPDFWGRLRAGRRRSAGWKWDFDSYAVTIRGIPFEGVTIPLWAPFLLLFVPNAFLWWRDRRVRPGFCRCGYDLKGLEGRPCPECGRVVQ